MESKTPRLKPAKDLKELPPEFLAEAERIARQYSAALKALAKH